MAKTVKQTVSSGWGKWVFLLVVLLAVVYFILPLLSQLSGAIGEMFQSILKITGSITDTVTAPFVNIAKDVAAGQSGALEMQQDSNMSDPTNPWNPQYYQQSSVSSDFTNLSDADSQDLVNSIQQAGSLFGAWSVGDQSVYIFGKLQDNIGSKAELSAFADYFVSHTGTALVTYLTVSGIGWSFDNTTWDPVSKWAAALPSE